MSATMGPLTSRWGVSRHHSDGVSAFIRVCGGGGVTQNQLIFLIDKYFIGRYVAMPTEPCQFFP